MAALLSESQGSWAQRWHGNAKPLAGLLSTALLIPGLLMALSEPSKAAGLGGDRGGDRIELRRQTLEAHRFWQATPTREAPVVGPAGPRSDDATGASPAASEVRRHAIDAESPSGVRLSDSEREQWRHQLRQRRFTPPAD